MKSAECFLYHLRPGEISQEYYEFQGIRVAGITNETIWIYDYDARIFGISRDDFSEKYNFTSLIASEPTVKDIVRHVSVDGKNDDLFIDGQDGISYRFTLPAKKLSIIEQDYRKVESDFYRNDYGRYTGSQTIPNKIDGELTLNGDYLYDGATTSLMITESYDYLINYKTLLGSRGKNIIARVDKNNKFVWQTTVENLFNTDVENGRTLKFSSWNNNAVFLVFEDFEGKGNMYVIKLDLLTGKKIWETVI